MKNLRLAAAATKIPQLLLAQCNHISFSANSSISLRLQTRRLLWRSSPGVDMNKRRKDSGRHPSSPRSTSGKGSVKGGRRSPNSLNDKWKTSLLVGLAFATLCTCAVVALLLSAKGAVPDSTSNTTIEQGNSPEGEKEPRGTKKSKLPRKTASPSSSSSRSRSGRPAITPDWVLEKIASSLAKLNESELKRRMAEKRHLPDRNDYMLQGRKYAMNGQWHNATKAFRHVLEHDPFDQDAEGFLNQCYQNMYVTGPSGSITINLTDTFLKTTLKHARQGWAEAHGRNITFKRLHRSLNAFVMDNFLSEEECRAFDGEYRRKQDEYSTHPLVCFQNKMFFENPRLKPYLIPNTYCFQQSISAALGPHLNWSVSAGCHRGECGLATMVEDRVHLVTGLPEDHGYMSQLLSYPSGVSYNDHTDCGLGNCGIESAEREDRVATFLVYLNDVDGGELSFPKLNISVQPTCGRAVTFFSYKNDCCDILSTHRSEMVSVLETKRKMAVQKWYSYRSIPFLSERQRSPKIKERLPYQPVVSCDYILDGGDTSCRWYDFWPFATLK